MRTQEMQFFNPWRDLQHLGAEVHNIFGWPLTAQRLPVVAIDSLPINVRVNDDGAILQASMPGVKADDIEVSVLGDTLTLKGSRKEQDPPEGAELLRKERRTYDFSRTVQLPFRVESQSVQARYHNGVLTLTLPRAAEDKKQRIAVQAA